MSKGGGRARERERVYVLRTSSFPRHRNSVSRNEDETSRFRLVRSVFDTRPRVLEKSTQREIAKEKSFSRSKGSNERRNERFFRFFFFYFGVGKQRARSKDSKDDGTRQDRSLPGETKSESNFCFQRGQRGRAYNGPGYTSHLFCISAISAPTLFAGRDRTLTFAGDTNTFSRRLRHCERDVSSAM